VVAAGVGEVAKRILTLAEEHGVPVQRDDTLVEILKKLPLGYEIPPEAYRLVAELLAWLFRTDLEWRKAREGRLTVVPEIKNS
jgi:flagellar biosynthesis protein